MLRVYLDQNKWVELAKELNSGQGGRLTGVFDVAKQAARSGSVSFPLSSSHFMETWNQHDIERRGDLVTTMFRLADAQETGLPDTLAAFWLLFPSELERALQFRFGLPSQPIDCRPFGRGYDHAFNGSATDLLRGLDYEIPATALPFAEQLQDGCCRFLKR